MDISKKIKRIKIGQKKVVIVFDNDDKLEISPNVYTEFNLFPNKSLSKKDIDELKKRSEVDKYFTYATKLLSARLYSKTKLKEKLTKKGANEIEIDAVIDLLIKYQMLDDDALIKEYLEYAEYKHFGYNRIKDDLFKKGVTSYKVDKIKYDEKRELKHAEALIKPFEKKYNKYNYSQTKKHCYDALLRYGFNSDIALTALNKLSPIDEKKEKMLLKEEYQKAVRKYDKKYKGYELNERISEYLLSKGYRYKDIKQIKE